MDILAAMLGPLFLAQASEGPYSPPPLPSPPRLAYWLFENPWPPTLALAALAVILFFIFNARGQSRQGSVFAVGLIASASACVVCSILVTTERERLADRTRQLITATATANLRALDPILASDVGLNVLGVHFPENKDGILGLVNRYMGNEYPVKEHSLSGVSASVDRLGTGKSLVRVRVEVEGIPNRSWWRLTWRKDGAGDWQAMHIEALQIDMVKASQIPR